MIKFFLENGNELDFSNQRLVLNEESDFFSENIVRNYSLPFYFYLHSNLSESLGLLNYENIIDYKTRIDGVLLVDTKLYNAFILIGDIVGQRVEAQLQYGKETLSIYSKKLSDLPWPNIVVPDLLNHAQGLISKSWPETSHNFPMIYRPEIKERDDYEAFKYFLNHHNGTQFLRNYRNDIEFSETSLIFLGVENFVQPITQSIQVNSQSSYTIETDEVWLSVNVNSGVNLTDVDVTVDFSSLVPLEPSRENKLFYGNVIVRTDSFERRLVIGLQINDPNHNVGWLGEFPEEENEEIVFNQNVMVPCVYYAEIIKFGFEQEGLSVIGDFVNSQFDTKKLYVPDNFMERFSSDTYDAFSFDYKTREQAFGQGIVYFYEKTLIPTKTGTYNLSIKINFSSGQAQRFGLNVTLKKTGSSLGPQVLFSAGGFNKQINIDEKVVINVTNDNQFDELKISMFLTPNDESIASHNSFVYELKQGRLNQFPNSYSLSDYMPDMTFGEFMSKLKTSENLDIDPKENIVFLKNLSDNLQELSFIDHSHLQDPIPKRTPNFNKVYQLSLLNGDLIWVDKTGQIFSIDDVSDKDLVKFPLSYYPLIVEENFNVITANFGDSEGLRVVLYDGVVDGIPVCTDSVDGRSLRILSIYENVFKDWLVFRTSSETYKDKFKAQVTEQFDYRKGLFKYNKKHLFKKIKRTRLSQNIWEVETYTETL